MKTYDVSRLPSSITLGWDGENNWRLIAFDCSTLLTGHPDAVVTLWLLPKGEAQAFPVALERDGDTVVWTPLNEEMTAEHGQLQIVVQDGTDVGKSKVIAYDVRDSLVGGADHPAETPSWATQVVADVTEAAGHYPRIVDGNWYVWDATEGEWVDTGVAAGGGDISPEDIAEAVEDYFDENPIDYPVDSVNGKTGAVTLSASDVHALPDSTVIPDISSKQDVPLIGSAGDSTAVDYVTPTQVYNALLAGKDVIINYNDMDFSGIYFTAWIAGLGMVVASTVYRFTSTVAVTLTGTISDNSWSLNTVPLVDGSRLAAVAYSGSYDDLTDKPSIPSLSGYATEAWVQQQGYQTAQQVQTAIANAAELPSGGSAGDFLRKTASGVAWQTVPSAESNSFGGGS